MWTVQHDTSSEGGAFNDGLMVEILGTLWEVCISAAESARRRKCSTLAPEVRIFVDEPRLTRIVRYLTLNHVLTEPEPGTVAHSEISKFLLANDGVGIDFVGHILEEVVPSAISQTDCLKNPLFDVPPEIDCGLAVALGGSKSSFFDVVSQCPETTKRFPRP